MLPKGRWWIKADGVDLICSLEESVRGDWNGDVDLDDRQLQSLRSEYLSRLDDVSKLNETLPSTRLELLISDIEKDLENIHQRKMFSQFAHT